MIFLLIGLINMKNRLFLIKEIYCLEKIKQAINDYKNLAVIELKEDENYYYCDLDKILYLILDYPHKHYTFKHFEV